AAKKMRRARNSARNAQRRSGVRAPNPVDRCRRQQSSVPRAPPRLRSPQKPPQPVPGSAPPRAILPSTLPRKILTSKATLEGERKQVTVLFADLKGSMELLAERDPEDARKLV